MENPQYLYREQRPDPIVIDSDSDDGEPQRAAKRQKMNPETTNSNGKRKPDPNLVHIKILPPKVPSSQHTDGGQVTTSPLNDVPVSASTPTATASTVVPLASSPVTNSLPTTLPSKHVPASTLPPTATTSTVTPPGHLPVTNPPPPDPPGTRLVIKFKMKKSGNATLTPTAHKPATVTSEVAKAVHVAQTSHVFQPSVGSSTPTSTPSSTPVPHNHMKPMPVDSPDIPRRPRGRPRKDGLNTRAARPDPSKLHTFSCALDGRDYGYWKDMDGVQQSGWGVLFPTGYGYSLSYYAKSWSCPVIGCTTKKPRLESLGKHFQHTHGDCMLYDLHSGHFQILGFHNGKDKPLVVCREKSEFIAWEEAVGRPFGISVVGLKHPKPQRVPEPDGKPAEVQASAKQDALPQTALHTSGNEQVLTPARAQQARKPEEVPVAEAHEKGRHRRKHTSSMLPRASMASPIFGPTQTPPHLELEQLPLSPIQQFPSTTPPQLLQHMYCLPMDEWELAPGHLRSRTPSKTDDGDTAPAESIAFSKPFLSANQSVRVSAEASFRIDTVKSGAVLRWLPKTDMLRIVSIGAGKVKVRIDGEDEFSLGAHGMFRLVSGKGCALRNILYGDALLHVCEFPE